ncbi:MULTISPECIES: YqhR family membrane protein [unclassified Virgibacillus]|uniref:YqhR family membrane protein n=1 Tax=unclassified Virgibacillus TaxID=2620237 RepID=UPI0024DEAE1A|nr:YqhR family membrane protein [Virgibacillus sp. LDC-1]
MRKSERKNNEREQQASTSPSLIGIAVTTGLSGGILWSAIGVVMYHFNFAEVAPKMFVLRSWTKEPWTDTWLGDLISILIVGGISILPALLYYALFKKRQSMWVGTIYGLALWFLLFYVLHPMFANIPNVTDLNKNTIVSTICLFLLYGTFIGYSISYDFHDMVVKETKKNNN